MAFEMGAKFCYRTLIIILNNKSKKISKHLFNQSMEKAL